MRNLEEAEGQENFEIECDGGEGERTLPKCGKTSDSMRKIQRYFYPEGEQRI